MKKRTFKPPTFQQLLRHDERRASRAAFYAVYLRVCLKLAPDEATYYVLQRYPGVRIPERLLNPLGQKCPSQQPEAPEEPEARFPTFQFQSCH